MSVKNAHWSTMWVFTYHGIQDDTIEVEDHSSTNGVEHAAAPSAWELLSYIKCQILASLFMVFRLSDVAFLAFWASCRSDWFIRKQASDAPVSQPSHDNSRVSGVERVYLRQV